MGFSTATVTIGNSTRKADYDRLLDNDRHILSGTATFTGAKVFQSNVTFSSPIIGPVYFDGSEFPTTSPTTNIQAVSGSSTYTLPRGKWTVALSNYIRVEVYMNGAWRTVADLKNPVDAYYAGSNGITVFSDGTTTRLNNYVAGAGNIYYYRL